MIFSKIPKKNFLEDKKIQDKGFLGAVDNQWGPVIHGWAICKTSDSPVTVKIVADSQMHYVLSNKPRKDIAACGLHPTGDCGFSINVGQRLAKPAKVNVLLDVGEIESSRPNFISKPIFFMHIAKTAGSSANRFFMEALGEKNVAVHVEAIKNPESLQGVRFISGHVGYESFFTDYFPYLGLERKDIYLATILRSPLKQLISHLNWVRHLLEPQQAGFLASHPPIVHEISHRLNDLDFSCPEDMARFVATMRSSERPLFDNCQSRYFYSGKRSSFYNQSDFNKALRNYNQFDFIGFTEKFEDGICFLAEKAGVVNRWERVPKVNVNNYNYGFDLENTDLIESILPLINFDNELYKIASNYQ